jgi:thiol-activated cytolysin
MNFIKYKIKMKALRFRFQNTSQPHFPFGTFLFFILGLILFQSCNKDFEGDLNEYLSSLPPISVEFPPEKQADTPDSIVEEKDEEYIYTVKYYSAAAGYDEQIVLNPQTDVIYPGALIKGESILDGSYVPIPAMRKPITISTSLTGGDQVSIDIQDPKLSTVREAINELMDQEYDVPPANIGFTIETAYSKEQFDLNMHASYNGIVDVDAGLHYENKKMKTKLVAKYIQSYYTLDMDIPAQPSDLFQEDVETALFGSYMPMYVSTVTFGRMALFLIESELSEQEVRTYLNLSYAGVDSDNSAEFDKLMASSNMQVYVFGGSGSGGSSTIDGFEAFKTYIKEGGNYSKTSPGAPISYKLRYIKDNTIGKIVFAASYPIRTAVPRTDNVVYDTEIILDSIKIVIPGDGNAEMVGELETWIKGDKERTFHNHWPYAAPDYFQIPCDKNNQGVQLANSDDYINNISDCKVDDIIHIHMHLGDYDGGNANNVYPWFEDDFELELGEIVLDAEGKPEEEKNISKKFRHNLNANHFLEVVFKFALSRRYIPD